MNNLIKRLLLGVIAVPLLIVIIVFLPFYNHLIMNILICALTVIGAFETRNMFARKGVKQNKSVILVTALAFPVFRMISLTGLYPAHSVAPVFTVFLSAVIAAEAFRKKEEHISTVMERMPAYLFSLFYPGFFMAYIIMLNIFPNSSVLILIFLTMVFANDTFAYFLGMAFGKNNRGIFAVSPNKSIAGLFGGITGSAAAGAVYFQFYPEIFSNKLIFALLTGVAMAATSVVGDLIESAMKRSVKEKDSGTIMQGRGGVLDSIDSILFSAPLFFYIILRLNLA